MNIKNYKNNMSNLPSSSSPTTVFLEYVRRRADEILSALSAIPAPDEETKKYLVISLFNTLKANAADPTLSIFPDYYHRDGKGEKNTLTYRACVRESTPDASKFQIVIESHMEDVVRKVFRNQSKAEITEMPGSPEFKLLTISKAYMRDQSDPEQDAVSVLGYAGALPNRENQIELFYDRYCRPNLDSPEKLREIFAENIFRKLIDKVDLASPIAVAPMTRTVAEVWRDLKEHLARELSAADHSLDGNGNFFYLNLISNLLETIDLSVAARNSVLEFQSAMALQRLFDLLIASKNLPYQGFVMTISACVDEVMFLMGQQQVSATSDQKEKAYREVKETVRDFYGRYAMEPPTSAHLTGSCMQAFSQAIIGAYAFFSKDKVPGQGPDVSMLLSDPVYFEVDDLLRTLGKKGFQESAATKDEIKEFFVGCFEANVSTSTAGYQFTDINAWVEHQFELRKASEDPAQKNKPLIVLVDNTMSHINEVHLPLFLAQFDREIQEGKLAVVSVSSLNKYFHMGMDKTGLGSCVLFSKPGAFPELEELSSKESSLSTMAGYNPLGPTVTLATSIMKDPDLNQRVEEFQSMCQGRVRYLYEKVVPASLKFEEEPSAYLSVSSPFNETGLESLNNNWGFLCLHLNKTFLPMGADVELQNFVQKKIQMFLSVFLEQLGLQTRDSFGFGVDNFCRIGNETLRISLGTESTQATGEKFKVLFSFMEQANQILSGQKELSLQIKSFEEIGKVFEQAMIGLSSRNMFTEGAYYDPKSIMGETLLGAAIVENNLEVVKKLVSHGADLTALSQGEWSFLSKEPLFSDLVSRFIDRDQIQNLEKLASAHAGKPLSSNNFFTYLKKSQLLPEKNLDAMICRRLSAHGETRAQTAEGLMFLRHLGLKKGHITKADLEMLASPSLNAQDKISRLVIAHPKDLIGVIARAAQENPKLVEDLLKNRGEDSKLFNAVFYKTHWFSSEEKGTLLGLRLLRDVLEGKSPAMTSSHSSFSLKSLFCCGSGVEKMAERAKEKGPKGPSSSLSI